MTPLIIPFDHHRYAVIPMGISQEDYDCLVKTLELWKARIVDGSIKTDHDMAMERYFTAKKNNEDWVNPP